MKVLIDDTLHSIKKTEEIKTLNDIISFINTPSSRISLFLNGEFIPKKKWDSTFLTENDVIESVSLVGGG